MLHGALDTQIMQLLSLRFPHEGIRSKTIEQVDRHEYQHLQALAAGEIAEDFGSEIDPVQYDDIMWRQFNRPPEARLLP